MRATADNEPAGGAPAGRISLMDEIDRKIIGLLQEDATLSVAQLADKVGLSPTPCWKRVQKLEANGVITRRVALVDPEKIGVGMVVYVAIEAGDHTPEWLRNFSTAIAAMPEVMEAHRMAGEVDYMLRVAVTGMSEFDSFYKRLIEAVPMRNVTSRFAMEQLKHTTAYPLHRGNFRDRSGRDGEG
jgi:Lrp/AsnC family transcriptional regulator